HAMIDTTFMLEKKVAIVVDTDVLLYGAPDSDRAATVLEMDETAYCDEGPPDPAGEGARRRSRGPRYSLEHDLARRDRDTAHAPPGKGHEARVMMAPKHFLGRLGSSDEIARAALYLARDASAFMTDLLINGGHSAV